MWSFDTQALVPASSFASFLVETTLRYPIPQVSINVFNGAIKSPSCLLIIILNSFAIPSAK